GYRSQENDLPSRRARSRCRGARQGRGQDPERCHPRCAAADSHRTAAAGAARHAGLLEPQGARSWNSHRAGSRAPSARVRGSKLRVVFDTNILVSALVFPGGRGEDALRRIIEERDELVLSKPIIDELLGILGRKFARDAEELAHAAVFLSELALTVKPRRRLHVVQDAL